MSCHGVSRSRVNWKWCGGWPGVSKRVRSFPFSQHRHQKTPWTSDCLRKMLSCPIPFHSCHSQNPYLPCTSCCLWCRGDPDIPDRQYQPHAIRFLVAWYPPIHAYGAFSDSGKMANACSKQLPEDGRAVFHMNLSPGFVPLSSFFCLSWARGEGDWITRESMLTRSRCGSVTTSKTSHLVVYERNFQWSGFVIHNTVSLHWFYTICNALAMAMFVQIGEESESRYRYLILWNRNLPC